MQKKKQYGYNRLRHFRKINHYKQREVMQQLGLRNPNLLTKWEQGKAYPSIINLFKLSIVYKTLPTNLYPDLYQALRECLEPRMARSLSNDNDSLS